MKLSIRQRIYLSFSLLVILFVINGIITLATLHRNNRLAAHVSTVVDPTMERIDDLKRLTLESKMYITNWVFLRSNEHDKDLLVKLHRSDYVHIKSQLSAYTSKWEDAALQDSLKKVFTGFEELLAIEKDIMSSLEEFDDYNDVVTKMDAERKIEDEVLPRTEHLVRTINHIENIGKAARLREHRLLHRSSQQLELVIILLAVTIISIGLFLAVYMTRVILEPIKAIKRIVSDLGKGIIRQPGRIIQKDEIGEMMHAVNNLSENTMATTRFAYEVGKRNFDIPFQPLSEGDVLGKALITMRDNLRASESELQKSASDLHTKDELLQAVAAATHELISNNDLDKAMSEAIRLLGLKMHIDRVSIYRSTGDITTTGHVDQLMQWDSKTDEIAFAVPEFQQLSGLNFAFDTLVSNEIYHSVTDEIADAAIRAIHRKNGVKCTIAIPVFVSGIFWGIVTLNDCKVERVWTTTEFSILKSFSATLGSAIGRHEMEAQLIDAKNKAEAASTAKSEFMANMSHELRTPLNGIIGFTDLVLTTDMNNTQRDYLSNVNKSAYNLLDIINDILDFSKIEAGRLVMDYVTFQLNEVIENTVDMLSIKAHEKKVELICNIDPTLPARFFGDEVRIRQVLVNLLGNAIKFTSEGEIAVSVRQGEQMIDHEGRKMLQLFIAVKDTGIGIPQDKINTIFESFTQADSSTTRKFGGTGLGLTISKALATLMGGNLWAHSEPGKGSTFTLQLPLEVMDESPCVTGPVKGVLGSVLVIDDNVTNCALMAGIFNYLNIPCETCNNGEEALRLIDQSVARGKPYDLIITDHQMPEMDGITLVKKVKERLVNATNPIVLMLSSLEKTMVQHEAEKAGINKFLAKPIKLNDLVNHLALLFQQPAMQKEVRATIPAIKKLPQRVQVLVAEDNIMNMALITQVLRKMEVDVIQAGNGEEALELLRHNDPALIFMDVNMPVLDGFETTRRIRLLDDARKDLPIIALTADAMQEDRERCMTVGMNDFVSKPFRIDDIAAVLNTYLPAGQLSHDVAEV